MAISETNKLLEVEGGTCPTADDANGDRHI